MARPGDMGFDIMHINLHKTFSTPHGGGGPGAGPVGVREDLAQFLPKPVVEMKDGRRHLNRDKAGTIGQISQFYGNFGVYIKAYALILTNGPHLRDIARYAVLNANYVKESLKDVYELPTTVVCKHEFVFNGLKDKSDHVTTLDVAKRLLDYGIHPPPIYFPLLYKEALMIEPVETESKQTIDAFIAVMKTIAQEAKDDPEMVKASPHTTIVRRLDEAKAARQPVLTFDKRT
jgi:Glycine cleavage system protein P (pyridoxal-binding), C-terminal domain